MGKEEIDLEEAGALVDADSSFAFEVSTLKHLRDARFACEHAGSYVDLVSKKLRQFDIKSSYHTNTGLDYYLAVECKQLGMPLLVHRLPRKGTEAYHDIIVTVPHGAQKNPNTQALEGISRVSYGGPYSSTLRLASANSGPGPYYPKEMVGKSLNLFAYKKDGKGGERLSLQGDAEVYDRMLQAMSSAATFAASVRFNRDQTANAILPVLVVPDEMLLAVDYDDYGHRASKVHRVDHCSFYQGQSFELPPEPGHTPMFTVSHMEIVVQSYLPTLLQQYCIAAEGHGVGMLMR